MMIGKPAENSPIIEDENSVEKWFKRSQKKEFKKKEYVNPGENLVTQWTENDKKKWAPFLGKKRN